jgi:predicted site-specific integrase-resolvase
MEWVAGQGVSYATALRWFKGGKLPVPAYQADRLIVVGTPAPTPAAGSTVVYARVSSADQRPDLDREVARITEWSTGQHIAVDRVVTEVGSALNGHLRKFLALLRDESVTTVVVEHRDRFARFGAEWVEAAMSAAGRRLLVVDPAEVDDDLVADVTEILTSLCARRYGRRAAADRAARAVAVATADGPS